MSDDSHICRRSYYRLRYPLSNRPNLYLSGEGNRAYQVTELSERGLRLHDPSNSSTLRVGHHLRATIHLPDSRIEVAAVVGRRDHDEVVLVEVEGISFGLIFEEQRRLATRFLATVDDD